MQTFILNGRFIRNSILSQALEEGCRESVATGKFPICAFRLTMPFEAVDVNVHPNKLEVRFSDERALCVGLASVVRGALKADPMRSPPTLSIDPDGDVKKKEQAASITVTVKSLKDGEVKGQTEGFAGRAKSAAELSRESTDGAPFKVEAASMKESFQPTRKLSDRVGAFYPSYTTGNPIYSTGAFNPSPQQIAIEAQAPIKIIGTAWRSYIIAEMEETLYFIDQHAAHERILYERIKKALDEKTASQILLTPQIIQLMHREHQTALSHIDDLAACGFEIEDFGDRSIQVRAAPMIISAAQTKAFFIEFAERTAELRSSGTNEQKRDAIIQMACKKAVKAGDSLSIESIEALIAQMRETNASPTCPHGRPLVIRVEKSNLDKRFRRV